MSFNPRARVGRDGQVWYPLALNPQVSIHAPAWGATSQHGFRQALGEVFQSTRPRGARRSIRGRESSFDASFNPRARVGRDTMCA